MSTQADQILAALGGADNVLDILDPHSTWLEIEVDDAALADEAALRAAGATGVTWFPDTYICPGRGRLTGRHDHQRDRGACPSSV